MLIRRLTVLVAEAQGSIVGLLSVHSFEMLTSGDQRADAHAFYAARGYHEKRVRFVKSPAT
jgi:hypothetical protein